jgi:hypothetical protein
MLESNIEMNADTVCNPNAEALNRALRQHVRDKLIKQALEIKRLWGIRRMLRGELNRRFREE